MKVEESEYGLDFMFKTTNAALRFTDFIGNYVPTRIKHSYKYISPINT